MTFRCIRRTRRRKNWHWRTVPLLTAGSIQTETRSGGRFVYRYRYDAGGKRVTEYLGAAPDPATLAKSDQLKQEMDSKIKTRIRPGVKRALALLGDDAPDAARFLEQLV